MSNNNENELLTEEKEAGKEGLISNRSDNAFENADKKCEHQNDNQDENKPEKLSFSASVLEIFETFSIAALAVVLIFSFVFRLCSVSGDSMNQTLQNGDRLIVSNIGYTPKRGDIIVFHMTGKDKFNEPLVKRVIATEGEWLDINFNTWEVRISDNPEMKNATTVDEPYIYLNGIPRPASIDFPIQIPEGCIFVMGDNRYNSGDSRSNSVGFVDTRRVLGKVLFRIFPFEKIPY